MTPLQVEAVATAAAPAEIVWSLVADATRYPQWGPWNAGGYEDAGDEGARVGAVQWFRYRRTTSVEQVLEVEPQRRIVYTVIRGIPVRNYRAEVTLTPVAEGTRIRWAATWDTTLLGRIVHRKLRTFYPEIVADLAAGAEQEAR